MYPHERSLVEEMKNEPFALIGINSDSTIDKAKKAIEENGLNWRSFQNKVEGNPKISDEWSIEGWPTIVVLDTDMTIKYRGHDGMKATDVAKALVEKARAGSE